MMKAAPKEEQYLIFRVGLVACCVPIESIDSVVRTASQTLHHFPNQANYISGVIQYRGSAISVVNLFHKFAQIQPTTDTGDYILAHTKFGLVGFWVNEVLDIVNGSDEEWGDAPSFLGDNIFYQTMLWKEKLILQSEFDRLVAMNDSQKLHEWAVENSSDLFHQQAANSDIGEPDIEKEIEDIEDTKEQQAQTKVEGSQPVPDAVKVFDSVQVESDVDEESIFVESGTIEIAESELNIEGESFLNNSSLQYEGVPKQSPSEQTIPEQIKSEQLAELESITHDLEKPVLVGNEVDSEIQSSLEHSITEADNLIAQNSGPNYEPNSEQQLSSETVVPSGFTEFMDNSSIASDFENTAYSASEIEENQNRKIDNSDESSRESQTELTSNISRTMTEILSLQTEFDEDSIHESTFSDVEALVPDNLVPDNNVTKSSKENRETEDSQTSVVQQPPPVDIASETESRTAEEKSNKPVLQVVDLENGDKNSKAEPVSSIFTEYNSDSSIDEVIDDYISDKEKEASEIENELGKTEGNHDDDLDAISDEKREASIRKVIDRIEKQKPENSAAKRFRLVASVMIAASAVFLVQHYVMNENGDLVVNNDSIELLAEKSIQVVDKQSTLLATTAGVTGEEKSLPVLPIPLKNGSQTTAENGALFPWRSHTVVRGDTLWHISEYYLKDPFRYPELARWSNIEDPDLIYPGDEVKYQDEFKLETKPDLK